MVNQFGLVHGYVSWSGQVNQLNFRTQKGWF